MKRIIIPATSANLGAGFDSIGIALKMYNTVEMQEWDIPLITSNNPNAWLNTNNLVYKSAKKIYDICGVPFKALKINCIDKIPMTRGLGSSSACIVGGITGANSILNNPLSKSELLDIATKLEGHPDNVAPCIFGSLVTSVLDEGKVFYSKINDLDYKIKFVCLIPNFKMNTKEGRKALPKKVSIEDAVFNLSRSSLFLTSLINGHFHNLKVASKDKLHQPYRLKNIKRADEIFKIAYENGAYSVFLSGSGPTILAMVHKKDNRVYRSLKDFITQHSLNWDVKSIEISSSGVKVFEI